MPVCEMVTQRKCNGVLGKILIVVENSNDEHELYVLNIPQFLYPTQTEMVEKTGFEGKLMKVEILFL